MTPALKRRWLQFGLRTLFVVVTLTACWLGWSIYKVNQRAAILDQAVTISNSPMFVGAHRLPFPWQALVAYPVELIVLPDWKSDADITQARTIFPEATVTRASGPGAIILEIEQP